MIWRRTASSTASRGRPYLLLEQSIRVRLGIRARTCHIVQNPAKRSYFGASILLWCGRFDENPRFYDKISSLKTIDNTTRILTKKVVKWGFHRSFGLYRAVLMGYLYPKWQVFARIPSLARSRITSVSVGQARVAVSDVSGKEGHEAARSMIAGRARSPAWAIG